MARQVTHRPVMAISSSLQHDKLTFSATSIYLTLGFNLSDGFTNQGRRSLLPMKGENLYRIATLYRNIALPSPQARIGA